MSISISINDIKTKFPPKINPLASATDTTNNKNLVINDDVHNYRLPKKSEIEEGAVMDNKDNNDKIVTQKSLLNDGTKTGFSIEDSGNIHDGS